MEKKLDCIDQQKRGRKEIIILYYAKRQQSHYKCSIQSINLEKEKKTSKKVVRLISCYATAMTSRRCRRCWSQKNMNGSYIVVS